ncbi:hypothetical protein VP01_119g1 [Puccinia sorghi]|uniref:Uncharacterized protein n=1 Tax=Puccinia sorghi TaxID=27349 RepID=A0A0L6VS26_9BASI|nr:hypothetical protein VP01_119g1 [Puccinia sorghi]
MPRQLAGLSRSAPSLEEKPQQGRSFGQSQLDRLFEWNLVSLSRPVVHIFLLPPYPSSIPHTLLRNLPFAPSTQRWPLSSYPETKTCNETDDTPQGLGLGMPHGNGSESANPEPAPAPAASSSAKPGWATVATKGTAAAKESVAEADRGANGQGGVSGTGGGRNEQTFFRSGAFDRPSRGSSHPSLLLGTQWHSPTHEPLYHHSSAVCRKLRQARWSPSRLLFFPG